MTQVYHRVMMLRDCAAVKRSHTCRTLIDHTLASHSHGVAMLVLEVYRYGGLMPSQNLLAAALVHDLSERYTGDMPATVKWANPALKTELNRISTMWETHNRLRFELTETEAQVLKFCDLMEFALAMLEERRYGNTFVDEYLRNCVSGFRSLPRPFISTDDLYFGFMEEVRKLGVEE